MGLVWSGCRESDPGPVQPENSGSGGEAPDVGVSSGGTESDSEGTGGSGVSTGGAPDSGTGGAADQEADYPMVDPGMGGAPPALGETLTVHIVGDSTAAEFPATDPRVGWGVALPHYFDLTIAVNNAAQSGRSSKSFYDEGHWGAVKALIEPGDYVFIQFGHNDEKREDPLRYTDPAITFPAYLNVYIGEARQLGAVPILLTPISRLQFENGAIKDTHTNYPEAVLAVGAASNTPVIDMTEKTRLYFEEIGQFAGLELFVPDDKTHTNVDGAAEMARLVAEGIAEESLPLAERLLVAP
jgi:lysophospholipase L1-like esterase